MFQPKTIGITKPRRNSRIFIQSMVRIYEHQGIGNVEFNLEQP